MNKEYDTCTKDNCKLSYDLFIDDSLIKLGFIYSNIGTYYYKKLICLLYSRDMSNININNLCILLAKELKNISADTIYANIRTTFRRIDKNKTSKNFYDVFCIPFDDYFITPKSLAILFMNTLNRIYR